MIGPLLLTGGTGQVGRSVLLQARAEGLDVVAPERGSLDLTFPDQIRSLIKAQGWGAIINCAAYTAVDRAESEPGLARAINAVAPAVMAEAAASAGIPLIHISTDYVFDGSKSGPYQENDPVGPLSVYGATKAEGEAAVRAFHPNHAILRTAWVVSAGPNNFLNTMLRLGAEQAELRVVDDQIGCPTNADDLARALLDIADTIGERSGTWHFVNSGFTSWHGLAAHIFTRTAAKGLRTPALKPVPGSAYPTAARRPSNSTLATTRLTADFGITPRPWQVAIDAILDERLG